MIDDETLFAYLDDELGPQDRARVEQALANDAVLRDRLQAHRDLSARLRAGFDPLLEAPLPPGLGLPATPVIDFAAARARKRSAPPRWTQWGAIAATLLVGIVAGHVATRDNGVLIERDGRLIASGPLADALDRQVGGAGADAGAVRVTLTFASRDGPICRSFDTRTQAGIACRDGDGWNIAATFANGEATAGDYRAASGGAPQRMALIEAMIAGQPFDVAREHQARERAWR